MGKFIEDILCPVPDGDHGSEEHDQPGIKQELLIVAVKEGSGVVC